MQVNSGPQYESPIKEVVEGVSSGLVGLHLKSLLLGELFTISRSWLILGGSARPQISKHQDTINKNDMVNIY